MKFQLLCLKCESTDVELYRETHGQYLGRWPQSAVYHCRTCGHVLYGVAAVENVQRQRGYSERQEAERQEVERQEAERQEVERQEAERQEVERQEVERQEVERQEVERQDLCALNGCRSSRRKGSIYCSRVCSNRNARSRYRARKKALGDIGGANRVQ